MKNIKNTHVIPARMVAGIRKTENAAYFYHMTRRRVFGCRNRTGMAKGQVE